MSAGNCGFRRVDLSMSSSRKSGSRFRRTVRPPADHLTFEISMSILRSSAPVGQTTFGQIEHVLGCVLRPLRDRFKREEDARFLAFGRKEHPIALVDTVGAQLIDRAAQVPSDASAFRHDGPHRHSDSGPVPIGESQDVVAYRPGAARGPIVAPAPVDLTIVYNPSTARVCCATLSAAKSWTRRRPAAAS